MKNKFVVIMLLLGSIISFKANALVVGDTAPCVVLEHVNPGAADTTHCIREPDTVGQFVVLEFFSIYCSDCSKNRPIFNELAEEISAVATSRFIAIDRKALEVREFIKNVGDIKVSVALDADRDAKKAYGVVSTPTLFILNDKQEVVYKHEGVLDQNAIDEIKHTVGVH